jgi:hypothetical protein
MKKLHVVFQQSDVSILRQAQELDESLSGEIIQIKDDFAVGPIKDLDTEDGWNERLAWWKSILDQSPYQSQELTTTFDDRQTVSSLREQLQNDSELTVWIWMAQNQHDVCGYFWLIPQLKDFAGRVMVLYLNNLPFINEKGQIFYPATLHEIQPKEFIKAKKLNRKVTPSEFEVDPDEWKRLAEENAIVRILEGGKKIVAKDADFYDRDILSSLTPDWQKGNRAIHQILAKMKIKTGDVFLLWRMKQLAEQDKIQINGDPSKGWKDFEVKLKTTAPAEAVTD